MTLEGKKVRLRPLSLEDIDHVMMWVNDPEVTRTLLIGRYPMSREAEREWIEARMKPSATETVFAIETKEGQYLGGINLFRIHPVERHAELGIVIGRKSAWGKGYATEAMELLIRYGFCELNLHMIYLGVMASNAAAKRVYERLGFIEEGCLRHRIFREGRYVDMYSMSLLRDEWRERTGSP